MAVLKAPIDPNGLASSKVRSTPCHDKHAAPKETRVHSLGNVMATGLKQVQKDIMKSKRFEGMPLKRGSSNQDRTKYLNDLRSP